VLAHPAPRRGAGSSGVSVLVNEAAEDVDPLNLRDDGGWFNGFQRSDRCGWLEVEATVRPGGVVMLQILSEDAVQLPTVPDQRPIQALATYRPDPALGISVGPRRQLHLIQMIGTGGCG